MVTEQALCPWCREGDHEGCIVDSDPYGPPCECDHDEPQQALRPTADLVADLRAYAVANVDHAPLAEILYEAAQRLDTQHAAAAVTPMTDAEWEPFAGALGIEPRTEQAFRPEADDRLVVEFVVPHYIATLFDHDGDGFAGVVHYRGDDAPGPDSGMVTFFLNENTGQWMIDIHAVVEHHLICRTFLDNVARIEVL